MSLKQESFNVLPYGFNRLAIFLCYDKDGIIDDYIPYLLNDLKENLTELVIAVNGKLTLEGRHKLEQFTGHIYIRENKGADAGGWKDAMIQYIGWDQLAQYDEIVLLNDSFYGPFYPFREVFKEMDKKKVDFWGLIAHGESTVSFSGCPYPNLPEHIQSYFIAIRKKMFTDLRFRQYWENMPYFTTVQDAISKHEIVFTKYFNDLGFRWDVFINTKDLDGEYTKDKPMSHCFQNTYELVKHKKCPILKRHCFGFSYENHLMTSNGMHLRHAVGFISKETNYDVTLIYKNIVRLYNIADIFNNLQLCYFLPRNQKKHIKREEKKYNAVLVFHIKYLETIEKLKQYICDLPEFISVIVVTGKEIDPELINNIFKPILGSRLRVIRFLEAGEDIAAFLIAALPYLDHYEYIGFCHDEKSVVGEEFATVGASKQELLFENVMGSSLYIENILDLFEEQPALGLLCVPPPCHAQYSDSLLYLWQSDYKLTEKLANCLDLKSNMKEDKIPLMNEAAFWCRREAILPFLDNTWNLNNLCLNSSIGSDERKYMAFRKIFPFVAQHQGYLTGWVMTDDFARAELNNYVYILTSGFIQSKFLHLTRQNEVLPIPYQSLSIKGFLIAYLKRYLPKPLLGPAKRIKHFLGW